MSRWSVRTFKWKSMRNGSWTGYYTMQWECDDMQQFVDCSWTDKGSHHTRNLFCRMWLSPRIRIYIEDLRYYQLRIYGKQLRINGTIIFKSMVKSIENLRYNHLKIYGTTNWGSMGSSIEDLRYNQSRIYGNKLTINGTIIFKSMVKSIENLRYNHLKIYGAINWGSMGPSIEDLQYNHLKIYGTMIWRSMVKWIEDLR
jgi:uncharacterized membrane protein YuzA (DUF378 family)